MVRRPLYLPHNDTACPEYLMDSAPQGTISMGQPTDRALLSGLAAGGEYASLSFIRRFQATVYAIAVGVSADPTGAEEIVTSAFEYAAANAHVYDRRRCPVGTWVAGIAAKAATDTLGPGGPAGRGPMALSAMDSSSAATHLETGSLEPTAKLRAALQQLPIEQARALVLAAFGGLPAAQIALAEDVPVQTARTRIRAAMHHLRAVLSTDSDGGRSMVSGAPLINRPHTEGSTRRWSPDSSPTQSS
jgi:DNA-directed RNA polymerase specialized sigma24 family protein